MPNPPAPVMRATLPRSDSLGRSAWLFESVTTTSKLLFQAKWTILGHGASHLGFFVELPGDGRREALCHLTRNDDHAVCVSKNYIPRVNENSTANDRDVNGAVVCIDWVMVIARRCATDERR